MTAQASYNWLVNIKGDYNVLKYVMDWTCQSKTITFVVANKQSSIKVELFAYMKGLQMQLALF